jgi:hypothetical protein
VFGRLGAVQLEKKNTCTLAMVVLALRVDGWKKQAPSEGIGVIALAFDRRI